MVDIIHVDKIERVPVPKQKRTKAKSDAAEWIEEMWPDTLTNIADASGYSRQHIRNTLEDYFKIAEPVGETADTAESNASEKIGHTVEVDIMDLIKIYRMGFQDGSRTRPDDAPQERGIDDILGITNQ